MTCRSDGERLLSTHGTTQVFEFADWMDFQPDSPSATKGTAEVRVRALGRTIAVRTRTGSQLRSAGTDFLPLLPRPPPWALGTVFAGLAAFLLVLAARQGLLDGLARRPLPASLSLVLAVALLVPPGRLQAGGGGSGPLPPAPALRVLRAGGPRG